MPFDYADLLDLLPSRRSHSGTVDALALPFPVAVFGTLRRSCWNHRFMETAGTMEGLGVELEILNNSLDY